MFTAELLFKRMGRARCQDAEWAIADVIEQLARNGQLIDREDPIVSVPGGYKAIVGMPERNSLRTSLNSPWVRTALGEVKKQGLQRPVCRILGRDLDSGEACKCRKLTRLCVWADMFDLDVPLCCGKCGGVVPLYRIPHTTEYGTYEDILFWARRYRALDQIWIESGVGEQLAYRELSRHDSDLSKTRPRDLQEDRETHTYADLLHSVSLLRP